MPRTHGHERLVGAYSPRQAELWGTFIWLDENGEPVLVTGVAVNDFRRYPWSDAHSVGRVSYFVRRRTWGSAIKVPPLGRGFV